jgi:hypothetical protein
LNFRSVFSFEGAGNFSLFGGRAASGAEKLGCGREASCADFVQFKSCGFFYDKDPILANTSARYSVLGFFVETFRWNVSVFETARRVVFAHTGDNFLQTTRRVVSTGQTD